MNRRLHWWGAICALIALTVLCLGGTALAAAYTMTCGDWIVRGNALEIMIEPREGATKYTVTAEDPEAEEDEVIFETTVNEPTVVTIPASKLAGVRFCNVTVAAKGTTTARARKTVLILDSEPAEGEVILGFSKTTLTVTDEFMYYVCAPGAQSVSVSDAENNGNPSPGQCKVYNGGVDKAGEYDYRAIAIYPDGHTVASDVQTITCVPEYDLGTFNPDIPAVVKKGKPLKITLRPTSNAGRLFTNYGLNALYDVTVVEIESNARIADWEFMHHAGDGIEALGSSQVLEVAASKLNAGNRYRITVEVGCYSCEPFNIVRECYVTDTIAPDIQLTVDGSADSAGGQLGGSLPVYVKLNPGVRGARLVMGGMSKTIYTEGAAPWPEDGLFYTTLALGEEGRFAAYVQCLDDSGAWSAATSNVVTVQVAANGTAAIPDVSIPSSVAEGDLLRIDIANAEADSSFTAGVRAVNLNNVTRAYDESNFIDGSFYVNASNLPAGLYRVILKHSVPGKIPSEKCGWFWVEPAEDTGSTFRFNLNANAVQMDAPLLFSYYAPGANHVKVFARRPDDAGAQPALMFNSAVDGNLHITFGDPGTYEVYARAYPKKTDTTYEESDHATVTVTSPGVTAGSATCPGLTAVGENVDIAVTGLEAANDHWSLSIVDIHDNRAIAGIDSGNSPAVGSFTVKAGKLEEGKVYSVNLSLKAKGWETGNYSTSFAVVNPDKVLTLPEGLTHIDANAFEGVDAQAVVLPSGVRSVAADAFAGCDNLVAAVIPADVQGVDSQAFPEGVVVIPAQ